MTLTTPYPPTKTNLSFWQKFSNGCRKFNIMVNFFFFTVSIVIFSYFIRALMFRKFRGWRMNYNHPYRHERMRRRRKFHYLCISLNAVNFDKLIYNINKKKSVIKHILILYFVKQELNILILTTRNSKTKNKFSVKYEVSLICADLQKVFCWVEQELIKNTYEDFP